jgi:nucleotide-binding universal stress UspA family protein
MFTNILVPVDLRSEQSWRKSLPLAVDQARHYGATLTLLYVVPDVWHVEAEPHENDALIAKLQGIAEELTGEDAKVELRVEHHNSAHRCIREVAEREGADLIVMTSHEPELRDPRLGSTATQVVHHADCSVLVVR